MPLIILEGPDESGKTTLAQRLTNIYSDAFENPIEVQRSPVKEMGWTHQYNHYIDRLADATQGLLVIQDRCPEISESIYGYARDEIRCDGWLSELGNWSHHDIFLVFCEGPSSLEEKHYDAEEIPIDVDIYDTIVDLYDYTYHMIEGYLSTARIMNFQVAKYNRFNKNQSEFFWHVGWWLKHVWPNKRAMLRHLEIKAGVLK